MILTVPSAHATATFTAREPTTTIVAAFHESSHRAGQHRGCNRWWWSQPRSELCRTRSKAPGCDRACHLPVTTADATASQPELPLQRARSASAPPHLPPTGHNRGRNRPLRRGAPPPPKPAASAAYRQTADVAALSDGARRLLPRPPTGHNRGRSRPLRRGATAPPKPAASARPGRPSTGHNRGRNRPPTRPPAAESSIRVDETASATYRSQPRT